MSGGTPTSSSRHAPGAIVFAGGGSGGHIYPGLAIAGEIERLAREAGVHAPRIVFAVSDRAIDQEVLNKSGVSVEARVVSPAKPVILRPKGIVRFLWNWGDSVRQARQTLKQLRAQHGSVELVAMGGFVAAPWVQGARVDRVKITMVNLDAVPGKANKWMAGKVDRLFTAARLRDGESGPIKTRAIEVPPIVRAASKPTGDQRACRVKIGLDPDRPVLMITGGSQGIRTINRFACAFAQSEAGLAALRGGRWQVIHQTGKNEEQPAIDAYRASGIDAKVQAFVDGMGDWWGAADLVVCTAGAGNVAEIWASKTPAMLMPYPYHKDQHQKYNALTLEQVGGVKVVTDLIDADANLRSNGPTLVELLTNTDRREAMRRQLGGLGQPDGALRIAQILTGFDFT